MTLEPCPFCGSADIRVVNDGPTSNRLHYGEQVYTIGCYQCGGSVPARFNKTLLVETWNTRAPDPLITELEQPCEPGSFAGDIWYGHSEKRTLGTHRWDGSAWQELPSEIEGCLSLLADARARIAALTAEVARKDALIEKAAQAAIDASAGVCAHWAERYAGASDEAKTAKKRVETRDFETMGMTCRFRETDIRALSASEIVKEMCGE